MKNKIKYLAIPLIVVFATLLLSILGGMSVSAATITTTPRTLISGTYTVDGTQYSGIPEEFKLYMYGGNTYGEATAYNGTTFNWSVYNFYVEASDVWEHSWVSLYWNGILVIDGECWGDESFLMINSTLVDGNYTLVYKCLIGNLFSKDEVVYTFNFKVDTTPPAIAVYNTSSTYVASGSYINQDFGFTAVDALSGCTMYMIEPGYTDWAVYGGEFITKKAGTYHFYAEDGMGNISDVYTINFDKTAPTQRFYAGGQIYFNNCHVNEKLSYVVSDNTNWGMQCFVKMPGSNHFISYISGTELSEEGTYEFYTKDRCGNISKTVKATYDITTPTITIQTNKGEVTSGAIVNAEYVEFVATDSSGIDWQYVNVPGSASYKSYESGTRFTEEGTYTFYARDKADNETVTYTITIDRSVPKGQLFVDGIKVDSGTYTNGVHISFESDSNCFVKMPESNYFVACMSGASFYKPGKYVFRAKNNAGTYSDEYTIVIDRTTKAVSLYNVMDQMTNGDVTLYWMDDDPNSFAPIVSVVVNGYSCGNGDIIHTIRNGAYKIEVADAAGNVWTTSFVSYKPNILTQTLQKQYYEANDEHGTTFAFSTWENAASFLTERENLFVRIGEWKSNTWDTGIAMDAKDSANAVNGLYYIYKKSGNPNEEVAYFTKERLNEVIAEYVALDITSFYYWEKTPAPTLEDDTLTTTTIIGNTVDLGDDITVLLNGELFYEQTIEVEGVHCLTIQDDWGNTWDYTIHVVRQAPAIEYTVGSASSNIVTFDRVYHFTDKVTVGILDSVDEMAMYCVYDEEGKLLCKTSLGEFYTIEKSGNYQVVAVNHAGYSDVFDLMISLYEPTIKMDKHPTIKKFVITITPSADPTSNIQTLEIWKSTDYGKTWTKVLVDDYGLTVCTTTQRYEFRTTGIYRVEITDEYRTGIDKVTMERDYVQPMPDGMVVGVEYGCHTNGTVTYRCGDEVLLQLTKDGEKVDYVAGQKLTEDGHYVLTIRNYDDYCEVFHFTIDTKQPAIETVGANHRDKVSGDVKVFFDENGVTAELFKDGRTLGEYISGNPISASGSYRVVVSDLAKNIVEVEFTIDKDVDFGINIHDKGLANTVVITAQETVEILLKKDGNVVFYSLGSAITEAGDYTATISDVLGNQEELSFVIVPSLAREFSYNFDEVLGFEKVMLNGEDKRLNYGTLELTTDGKHKVDVVVYGEGYSFEITIDSTPPTATLQGVSDGGETREDVVISEWSDDAILQVFLNDTENDYILGDPLTESGVYRVVLTDTAGNSTTYNFTIDKSMSVGGIVAISAGGVTLVAGIVLWILKRRGVI